MPVADNTLTNQPGYETTEIGFFGAVDGQGALLQLAGPNRLARIDPIPDNNTALELIVPQRALSATAETVNFEAIAANSNYTFWCNAGSVYGQRHARGDTNARFIAKSGSYCRIAASEQYLYLYLDDASARQLYRYDLSSGSAQTLYDQPRGINYVSSSRNPLVVDSSGAYWGNGSEVLFIPHASTSVATVAAVTGEVESLFSTGTDLYVHHIENSCFCVPNPAGAHVITKVNLSSGVQTEVLRRGSDVTDRFNFIVNSDRVFWAAHEYDGTRWNTRLYKVLETGESQVLMDATSDFGMIGVSRLATAGGKIAIAGGNLDASGALLLLYDPALSMTTAMMPATRALEIAVSGSNLYVAGFGNVGIARLDASKPIRQTTQIASSDQSGTYAATSSMVRDGFAYWTENQPILWPNGGARILRMRLDGSAYQVMLTNSTGELKDLVVAGGRLYFLCHAACGDDGWVIASIAIDGGAIKLESLVPFVRTRLFASNDILYLTGSNDGRLSSISAVNIAAGKVQLLVDRIPYPDLALTFSSAWLYWGGSSVTPDGAPARGIARHRLQAWDRIGSQETIVAGVGLEVADLAPETIHNHRGYTYYWHRGLKRVGD